MAATSLDLSQIKTDALSSAATFRSLVGLGAGDSATFSSLNVDGGTVVSSTPLLDATQTWNDGATTFTGMKLNVTDTASASASLLMDLQVGGSSRFKVDKNGNLVQAGDTSGRVTLSSGVGHFAYLQPNNIGLSVSTSLSVNGSAISVGTGWASLSGGNGVDLVLAQHVANTGGFRLQPSQGVVEQRNGVSAQTFRLYNTYTSATSYENLQLQWNTNEARIGTSVGSAGGTQRNLVLGSWNSAGAWNPAITLTPQGVPTFSMGTVTTSQPFTVSQTWNDGATTFTGIKLDVIDTASASASLLLDLQVGGSSKFSVDKRGYGVFVLGLAAQDWIRSLTNSSGISFGTNSDVQLVRDAANTLAQRRSTNAQAFRIYNTYTSGTSFENLQFQWNTNEARIGTSVGSAGGTQRNLVLGSWDSAGTWNPSVTVGTEGTVTVAETVSTPTGTTETIDLGAGNHQTLDLGSASGDLTITLTVPSGSSAGTILLLQGATVRNVTWTPSSGTIIWMGGEPTWSSDTANTSRIIAWRWNGTDLRLAPSEQSA